MFTTFFAIFSFAVFYCLKQCRKIWTEMCLCSYLIYKGLHQSVSVCDILKNIPKEKKIF